MNRFLILPLLAAVAACSDEPAGGVGYFDQNSLPQNAYGGTALTSSQQALMGPNGDPLVGTIENALNEADGSYGNAMIAEANAANGQYYSGIGIDPGADSINLALYSQEQQKIDRENAARELALARSQLVIVSPDQVQGGSRSNVLQTYARSTTNSVGQKVYRRGLFSDAETTQINCSRYRSADDAQKAFLAAGGPASDSQQLDPDGDGFACAWSPVPWRG
jgi:hypothetical protein